METAEHIVEHVTRLVAMPQTYLSLQALIQRDDADLNQFARIIEKDPGIAAKVLSVANSSFYGFSTPIDTISRAVNILGIAQLHDLVLFTSVMNSFKDIPAELMDIDAYWRRSIFCGLLGMNLAEKCRILDSSRMFVQGLLLELGHLVLYLVRPQQMMAMLQQPDLALQPLYQVERAYLGCDYAAVGAALMKAWKLPLSLQEAAACHIEPAQALEFPLVAALLHLAWRYSLAEHLPENSPQLPAVEAFAWRISELKEEDLEQPLQQARASLQEALRVFNH